MELPKIFGKSKSQLHSEILLLETRNRCSDRKIEYYKQDIRTLTDISNRLITALSATPKDRANACLILKEILDGTKPSDHPRDER